MAPQSTARVTRGLSGWIPSSLPDVVIDPPDEERGRRDRVVDATMYLVAFAISVATLVAPRGRRGRHRNGRLGVDNRVQIALLLQEAGGGSRQVT
jgi:hypothetical protein